MAWRKGDSACEGPASGKTLSLAHVAVIRVQDVRTVIVLGLATRQGWGLNVNTDSLTWMFASEMSWKREKRTSAG